MDISLFGIQGSGKGTQSRILAERFNFEIFETGAELRKLSQEESPLGQKVQDLLNAGKHVDTDIVMEIVQNFIQKLPEGKSILFDGIPRNFEQKEAFDAIMKEERRDFMGVLIELDKDSAIERLTTRRICQDCKTVYPAFYKGEHCEKCKGELITRKDDTPEAIQVRIDLFMDKTLPTALAYEEEGKMMRANGDQAIETVTEELIQIINDLS